LSNTQSNAKVASAPLRSLVTRHVSKFALVALMCTGRRKATDREMDYGSETAPLQ